MNTPDNTSLQASIDELVPKLPVAIRRFFTQGKVEMVTQELMAKFGLHIDQAAVLQREIIMMLLGINAPATLPATLAQEALLGDQAVGEIIEALNQRIFEPLRREMEGSVHMSADPVRSAPFVPRTAPPPINLPGAPKPEQLLEDHEEPHIEVPRPSMPIALPPMMPRPAAQFAPPLAPQPMTPAMPQAATTLTAPMPAPRTIVKEYASDPYHEPIEEK